MMTTGADFMRVLMINSNRGFVGGVERMIHKLSMEFIDQGWEVYGFFENTANIDNEFDRVFTEIITSSGSNPEGIVQHYKKLHIDLVFIHKFTDPAVLIKLQAHFPTVVLVHDHEYYCLRRHKYFPFKRINCSLPFNSIYCSVCSMLMQKRSDGWHRINLGKSVQVLNSIRDCDLFFVLSDFMKRNLIANGFDEHKINIMLPHQEPAAELEAPSGSVPIVLYVGQLIRGKGVDLLIKAFRELRHPAILRIVGRGNDEEYLQRLCEEFGISHRVQFAGWMSDLTDEYNSAALVCVPSRWQEPFGLVGIEAFAKARTVIAFDVGGISQWLKHGKNGLLVRAGNISGFTKAIDSILGSPQKAQSYAGAAVETVKECYNRDLHNQTLFDPLNNLIKQKRSNR